jgi:predicted secreted protein
MVWFTRSVLFVLIWWTLLFAVLPFMNHPNSEPDPVSGWRGTPTRPFLARTVLMTTLVSVVVWVGALALIHSGWISFRHGWFAMPYDKG